MLINVKMQRKPFFYIYLKLLHVLRFVIIHLMFYHLTRIRKVCYFYKPWDKVESQCEQ